MQLFLSVMNLVVDEERMCYFSRLTFGHVRTKCEYWPVLQLEASQIPAQMGLTLIVLLWPLECCSEPGFKGTRTPIIGLHSMLDQKTFTFLRLLLACTTSSQIQEITRSFLGSGLTRNILECSLALDVLLCIYTVRAKSLSEQ